jgi:hypothetical protein
MLRCRPQGEEKCKERNVPEWKSGSNVIRFAITILLMRPGMEEKTALKAFPGFMT